MELDFSKLEGLAYRGFDKPEARAEKDSLIDQGFTIVDAPDLPFKADEQQAPIVTPPPQESPSKRKLEAFTSADKSRNYRAMYRAACNFHEAHNPPTIDREYWRTHTRGIDDAPEADVNYWVEATKEIGEVVKAFNNDPFITGMLMAIYEELEREYSALLEDI